MVGNFCKHMSHINTMKIMAPEALQHQRRQHADAARRALEQSALYSEELGIDLARGTDAAYFRWFLASLLFGARISETTAKKNPPCCIRRPSKRINVRQNRRIFAGMPRAASTKCRRSAALRYFRLPD